MVFACQEPAFLFEHAVYNHVCSIGTCAAESSLADEAKMLVKSLSIQIFCPDKSGNPLAF